MNIDTFSTILILHLTPVLAFLADPVDDAGPIVISSANVVLIEEIRISAADSGIIDSVKVSEGAEVSRLQTLASLDSTEQQLAVDASQLALDAAELQQSDPLPVATAKSVINEASARLDRTKTALQIAQREATDNFLLKIAETESAAANEALKQATEARAKHRMSVSDAEYRQLTAVATKGRLQVSQSESDHEVMKLQVVVRQGEIKEQEATVARQKLLLEQEERKGKLNDLTVSSRQKDLALAELLLARRFLKSPINGIVAEIYRRPGEWVEKGSPVLKVVNLDRLRIEGFIDVHHVTKPLVGGKVSIRFPSVLGSEHSIKGVVTHVAPQVDTVNQRLRLWAEFSNKDRLILPGMVGEMLVTPATKPPAGDRAVE